MFSSSKFNDAQWQWIAAQQPLWLLFFSTSSLYLLFFVAHPGIFCHPNSSKVASSSQSPNLFAILYNNKYRRESYFKCWRAHDVNGSARVSSLKSIDSNTYEAERGWKKRTPRGKQARWYSTCAIQQHLFLLLLMPFYNFFSKVIFCSLANSSCLFSLLFQPFHTPLLSSLDGLKDCTAFDHAELLMIWGFPKYV